jgi:ABC-2 type transport system ATP-binding protein
MSLNATGPAIEVRGLRKSFGDKPVLDGIDLTVPKGTSLPCSAPTGQARRRAAIGVTSQFSSNLWSRKLYNREPSG